MGKSKNRVNHKEKLEQRKKRLALQKHQLEKMMLNLQKVQRISELENQ